MTITLDSITALISACRRTIALSDALSAALDITATTELDNISAEIEDALCIMRGEDTNSDLDTTLTDQLIRNTHISCESAAEVLCDVST